MYVNAFFCNTIIPWLLVTFQSCCNNSVRLYQFQTNKNACTKAVLHFFKPHVYLYMGKFLLKDYVADKSFIITFCLHYLAC